jgi:hypothetical protein
MQAKNALIRKKDAMVGILAGCQAHCLFTMQNHQLQPIRLWNCLFISNEYD